jgi:hypothetical protein
MYKVYTVLATILFYLPIGCVKQKFDTPLLKYADTSLPLYWSIATLRMQMGNAGFKVIQQNVIITGIVIADDMTSNLYKQIIIDDGTAAIPILLDAYNLYTDFPIGRKIIVNCKGLYTNFYYKLPQLGYLPDNHGNLSPIPFMLWDKFIQKGALRQPIKPIPVSIAEAMKAKSELFNRLVQLQNAQIMDTLNTPCYAFDPLLSAATTIKLMDCDSNSISLRTSAFASFRSMKPSYKRGALTAIYTVFNNTPQLILRDTADVQFNLEPCF